MAIINPKILGPLESDFYKVLLENKVAEKGVEILSILQDAILGKIEDVDMVALLKSQLNLEFDAASDLAYDLKVNILDKKADLGPIVAALQQDVTAKFMPQYLARDYLAKLNYQISNPTVQNRYLEALISWLKGVRDIPELKEVLMRSAKIGGVGMSEEVFYQLYDLLIATQDEAKKQNIDLARLAGQASEISQVQESDIDVSAKVARPASVVQTAPQDVTIDQILAQRAREQSSNQVQQGNYKPAPQATPVVQEIEQEENFLNQTSELATPQIVNQSSAPAVPKPAAPAYQMPSRSLEARQPLVNRSDTSSGRPQMTDVKFEPRLYGPLDELAALGLQDFRRLSKDPKQAAQKILAKLEILESESVVRKNEGIKALKSSPLYKIYASVMNKALISSQPFEQVIKDRGDITPDEFKAIMELNKSLKY